MSNNLFLAIQQNDIKTFNKLNKNVDDEYGNTPLHLAVMKNNELMMIELIKYFDIDTKNKFGESPRSLAIDYDSDLMIYVKKDYLH